MSLEAKIEELTAAVVALTKAIGSIPKFTGQAAQISAAAAQQAYAAGQDSIVRELENTDLRLNPINKIEDLPNEQSQITPPTSQTSAEESKPVVYSDVSKLVTQIAKTNVMKAKAALARLGVKHGKELTEAQWPEAVTYLTRVAAGEVDPEASHE